MILATGELPEYSVRKLPPSMTLWWLMLILWLTSTVSTAYLVLIGRTLSPESVEIVLSGELCPEFARCDEVLQSEYSTFLGVSLSKWSALFLLMLLVTLIASAFGGHDTQTPPTSLLLPVIAAFGMAAAIWLFPLLLIRLNGACLACLILHVANVALFICAVIYSRQAWLHRQFQRWISGEPPMPPWPRILQVAAIGLIIATTVTALAMFRGERITREPPETLPVSILAVLPDPNFNWQLLANDDKSINTWIGSRDAPVRLSAFVCLTNKESARLYEVLRAVASMHPDDLRVDLRFDPQWPNCNANYTGRLFSESHRDACAVSRLAIALALVDQKAFEKYVDWAFSNQDKLNEDRAIAEARFLIGEDRLREVQDSRSAWEQATTDMQLASDLKIRSLPKLFCKEGELYGGADAVNIAQFLMDRFDVAVHKQSLPSLEPIWMGESSIASHARSGANLYERERYSEAAVEMRRALQLKPRWPVVAAQLAWLLATCPDNDLRDGQQSLHYARLAVRLAEDARASPSDRIDPVYYQVLAAAYAENAEFELAIRAAAKAVDGYLIKGDIQTARSVDGQRAIYKRQEAVRSTELAPTKAYITAK